VGVRQVVICKYKPIILIIQWIVQIQQIEDSFKELIHSEGDVLKSEGWSIYKDEKTLEECSDDK
jgi:hypothetical protein